MFKSVVVSCFIFVILAVVVVVRTEDSSSDDSGDGDRGECVDKVHNYVVGKSPEKREIAKYPAKITKFSGTIYDIDNKPSCHAKRPTVFLPGYVKLIDGKLIVDRDFDLVSDGFLRMTVHGADFDEALCLNGTSQYVALPSSFCRLNLCEFIGAEMCKVLGKKGIHTLDELEQKLGFNRTLKLPDPPSVLGISFLDFFSGEFNFGFAVETEGKTILEMNIPTNDEFLQIGVE